MSFKAFKMKKQGLKRGFKRLSGLFAKLYIRELVNWWFRFFDVTNRLIDTALTLFALKF